MKTFLLLDNKREKKLPSEFRSVDIRNPENLVHYLIKEFTKKGDIIFDPFAGFGTTLIVSEEMSRTAFGVEVEKKKVDYIQSQIKNKSNIIEGNSLQLNSF